MTDETISHAGQRGRLRPLHALHGSTMHLIYIYRYIIDRFNEIRVSTPAYILSRNIIMKSGSWLLDYIEFISNEYLRKNGMELTLSTFQLV